MIGLSLECPFCGAAITAHSITSDREREAGLVYLLAKCIPCESRFESVGLGEQAAAEDMARVLRKRVGTVPGDWRIRVRQSTKGKR